MKQAISVVINTKNAAHTLPRTLKSVSWADEIIIMDMHSTDSTVDIAKKHHCKIFATKDIGYVEPARKIAISKASHQWILVVDADEEIPSSLASQLPQLMKGNHQAFYIPRKNIIFNKWIKHTGWWPDYQLRFFQPAAISWPSEIHSNPIEHTPAHKLEATEKNAIIHHNYQTVEQFITRLNKYTSTQAELKHQQGVEVSSTVLVKETADEFLKRYYLYQGYKDGFHGLVLSLLQAFSQFVTILKLWQIQGFEEVDVSGGVSQLKQSKQDLRYWKATQLIDKCTGAKKLWHRLIRKLNT